jgi:urease accessory protein UreF
MRSEEASGFMRWLETSLNVAAQTQDPSALDWVDFDTAQPELADILAVPNRWVATREQVDEKRQGRQQGAQQQQLVQSLPGIAALAKAGVGGAPA